MKKKLWSKWAICCAGILGIQMQVNLPAYGLLITDFFGVDKGAPKSHRWAPKRNNVAYGVEDNAPDGSKLGYYLNPGWGGQAYDAEALYVGVDSEFLHISMITGFQPEGRKDGRNPYFGAGDLFLDLDQDGIV